MEKISNTVNKASIIPDVWKNFRDRIKDQVITVTITGGTVVNVGNVVASFPDQLIDSKSEYPIIVIEDPKTPTDPLTTNKTQINGTIKIGVYTNQAESASKFIAQVINAIETYKGDLSKVGIRNIGIYDTNQDSFSRDKIKVHYRYVIFDFVLFYSNTVGF